MDSPFIAVFGLSLLLGIRHAADPDHLVAVSTLIAGAERRAAGLAARLGAFWGAGHALSLVVLGLPIVIAGVVLPELVQRLAESAIGVIIVVLAARLLLRWRSGRYHLHVHDHDGRLHTHVHAHARADDHRHRHLTVRTPLQAFAIGVVHGVGGSAAVALLLLASIRDEVSAAAALCVFAAGTAASMAAISAGIASFLGRGVLRYRLRTAMVPLGIFGLAFGVLYAGAAWLPGIPLV